MPLALPIPCPHCGALPYAPCRTYTGSPTRPHRKRRLAHERAQLPPLAPLAPVIAPTGPIPAPELLREARTEPGGFEQSLELAIAGASLAAVQSFALHVLEEMEQDPGADVARLIRELASLPDIDASPAASSAA